MNTTRQTARIAGALFLIALATDLIGGELIARFIHAPDYLTSVHPNRIRVITGMVLELIAAASVVGIAATLFSVLKKHSERMALTYVGLRIVEAVTLVIYVFGMPSILTLSREYLKAGAPSAPYFQALGASLLAATYWVYPMVAFFFSLGALLFYHLLHRSRLIPRFIPVWGLIGVVLLLVGTLLGMFGYSGGSSVVPQPGIMLYAAPIALNEVFLAMWLILKGFKHQGAG